MPEHGYGWHPSVPDIRDHALTIRPERAHIQITCCAHVTNRSTCVAVRHPCTRVHLTSPT
jgi:hypothetical protein